MMDNVIEPSIIECSDLAIQYASSFRVGPLSFRLGPGERLGIAGESGCGKTTLLDYLAGVPRRAPAAVSGQVTRHPGLRTGYAPQDPVLSLSPFLTALDQVADVSGSKAAAAELLAKTGLRDLRRLQAKPSQLSGGERQRVLFAQALASRPRLILADEPIAQLDGDTADQILDLLDQVARDSGAALIVASHQERVFERLRCQVLRLTPAPRPLADAIANTTATGSVVWASGLKKKFSQRGFFLNRRHTNTALDDVSLGLGRGETVALMGRSGSGKSTLARCLAGFVQPDAGSIEWSQGCAAQLVRQEPSTSLNPSLSVAESMLEAQPAASPSMLDTLSLPEGVWTRKSSELSEGQRARVAVARALAAAGTGLLILDESFSSLDDATASVVASAVQQHQSQTGMACLLITHDQRLASALAHRTLRMIDGRLVA